MEPLKTNYAIIIVARTASLPRDCGGKSRGGRGG